MPCDSVVLNQVDFTSAKGFEPLLKEALTTMGYRLLTGSDVIRFRDLETGTWCSFQNGTFTVPEGFDVDAVKQEFSKVVVKTAAKKFGWPLKENGNKLTIRRKS